MIVDCQQIVEVRIESVDHRHDNVSSNHDNDNNEGPQQDIETRAQTDSEPLLLVFSNDRHHRRFDSRELHDLIEREMELYEAGDLPAAAVAATGIFDYDDDEYVDVDDYDAEYYDGESEQVVSRQERDTAAVSDRAAMTRRDHQTSAATSVRVRRAKLRRRLRRNICRRKAMYVNFEDIHWNGWIIEPKGYQVNIISQLYYAEPLASAAIATILRDKMLLVTGFIFSSI